MHAVFDTVFEVSSFPRFQYLELSATHSCPCEARTYWSLLYADKGAVTVVVDGVEQIVETGNALLCEPDAEFFIQVRDKQAANLYFIGFVLEKGTLSGHSGKVFPMTGDLRAHVKLILKEAKFAYSNDLRDPEYSHLEPSANPPFGAEQMMRLLLEQFLIHMVRDTEDTKNGSYKEIIRENLLMINLNSNPYFDKLVRYLEENIEKQLTLDDICRDNFTNRSNIQRVFRECTSEGIISFHQKLKIEYAKRMIRESSMNFTQISEALGFSSVHHFSKKFKQLVKMSPSEYARFAK